MLFRLQKTDKEEFFILHLPSSFHKHIFGNLRKLHADFRLNLHSDKSVQFGFQLGWYTNDFHLYFEKSLKII